MSALTTDEKKQLGKDLQFIMKGTFGPMFVEVHSWTHADVSELKKYLWDFGLCFQPSIDPPVIVHLSTQRLLLEYCCREVGRMLLAGELTYDKEKHTWNVLVG